jgi:hypothetical protein
MGKMGEGEAQMSTVQGTVALIGSGEFSGTMVEIHKKLLNKIKPQELVLFLDTPAGFQENVDLLASRAVDYFKRQVLQRMEVASYKSAAVAKSDQADVVFGQLNKAGYLLIGPGSPTYTVRQLKGSPVTTMLGAMVTRGGSLVAASAAALSVGVYTLPVYEIYKVGEPVHWVEGLNILGNLGLDLVVIPHWNNAEGGNHDTRFCYMGEKRFRTLEAMLPSGTTILGIDEHTVCILDFATENAVIDGLGQVIIRNGGFEKVYKRGDTISFNLLKSDSAAFSKSEAGTKANRRSQLNEWQTLGEKEEDKSKPSFWDEMHDIEGSFNRALEEKNVIVMIKQLLEADRLLWQAQLDLENPEFISQGRELFREMIVLSGTSLDQMISVIPNLFSKLVNVLIRQRDSYRQAKRWPEADQIRQYLHNSGVVLEDTEEGTTWHLKKTGSTID